jgi:hypothetical protein
MVPDPELDQLSRDELVVKARALGAKRPEVMTRVELRDEIVRLGESDPVARRHSRGWLGVARDLVASVVDSGLNMPGAAAAIRGEAKPEHDWQGPPPVATLTLAEIYVAQGHTDRALGVLEEVLSSEPDHAAAIALRERLAGRQAARREPERAPSPVPAPARAELTPGPAAPEPTAPEPAAPDPTAPEPAAPEPTAPEPTAPEPTAPEPTAPEPTAPEPTVRGGTDGFPDRPACAHVTSRGGVEALYELPESSGPAVLRIVWFKPQRGAPERLEVDLPVEPGYHRRLVEGPGAGVEVRAALGVLEGETFVPIAVAWVYEPAEHGPIARFAPPAPEPPTLRARVQARVVELG